jgi:hypothetical protein
MFEALTPHLKRILVELHHHTLLVSKYSGQSIDERPGLSEGLPTLAEIIDLLGQRPPKEIIGHLPMMIETIEEWSEHVFDGQPQLPDDLAEQAVAQLAACRLRIHRLGGIVLSDEATANFDNLIRSFCELELAAGCGKTDETRELIEQNRTLMLVT